jgi:hypothetical protein
MGMKAALLDLDQMFINTLFFHYEMCKDDDSVEHSPSQVKGTSACRQGTPV